VWIYSFYLSQQLPRWCGLGLQKIAIPSSVLCGSDKLIIAVKSVEYQIVDMHKRQLFSRDVLPVIPARFKRESIVLALRGCPITIFGHDG
jgi:hypothetical protein